MPEGYRLEFHETIDSTNSESLRMAERGEAGNVWIHAAEQSAGRGRSGRSWESLEGNLFASLLIYAECPQRKLPELGFVAGVALHETVSDITPSCNNLDVALKWPNDLLFNGKKIAGLLLESKTGTNHGLAAVIGFGLNVISHPGGTVLSATSLKDEGVETSPSAVMESLAASFVRWRSKWDNGADFEAIRTAWLDRAMPDGSTISVHAANETLDGVFSGIDDDGALLLRLEDKSERRITAGDIFPL